MNTQFRRAILPRELRSLVIFDHKAFHEYPSDWFDREVWKACEPWWMIAGGEKIGCCGFEPHVDFLGDVNPYANPRLRGSLYIVTTGILPRYQGQGFGDLLKCWQVLYARRHGFTRIVTNTRKGNQPMIALNKKFGFRVLRTTPGYYRDPPDSTVVMELLLG